MEDTKKERKMRAPGGRIGLSAVFCFTAVMSTGKSHLPQGVTEARLKQYDAFSRISLSELMLHLDP